MIICTNCESFIPVDVTCPDCGDEPVVAQVIFQIGDLDFTNWDKTKRERFFKAEKKCIEDRLCDLGNKILEYLVSSWKDKGEN